VPLATSSGPSETSVVQLVRARSVPSEYAGLDHPDRRRPAVRTEVGAEQIELLSSLMMSSRRDTSAAEGGRIDGTCQKFARNRLRPCGTADGCPGPSSLHVGRSDVSSWLAATASCSGDVMVMSAPQPACRSSLSGAMCQCDDMHRILGPNTGYHVQARSATAPATTTVSSKVDSRALAACQRAGQRSGECSMVRGMSRNLYPALLPGTPVSWPSRTGCGA